MAANSPTPIHNSFLALSTEETLQQLSTSNQGLAPEQIKPLLAQHGPNELKAHKLAWWQLLLRQFQSPFIYLLVAAAGLAFFLGEWLDGVMILIFVLINAVLGFFQEYRSEQALKALKRYTAATAHVTRNGQAQVVPINELVPGDLVSLQPGDIVPADLRLLSQQNLLINESVLTGESEPSPKTANPVTIPNPSIHQAANIAFASTSVISGAAQGVVIATGSSAYIGSIAKLTVETQRTSSFEKGMNKFSTFVLRLVSITLLVVFFTNLIMKGGDTNIADMIIFSIALATAAIPEALPLVITFCLSRGALRLAKHNVVVKRLSAIEDLGGIEILATDKTGTITENKLTVTEVSGDRDLVLTHASLAISHQSKQKDPFDTAILEALGSSKKPPHVLHEIPFDPDRKRNSVLVNHDNQTLLIVRGAAESILPYLKTNASSEINKWIKSQGELGRRVIVVAHKPAKDTTDYTKQLEETDLVLSGAISFVDPLKKTTPAAIRKAQQLGITVKIITGDSPTVAGAVAHEIGLIQDASEVITAQDFFALSSSKQHQTAHKIHVFARFSPHEKHQLIEILQEKSEVGFLGEGINDAPALKIANVALVVQGASDIARESADVILLNSSLNVIIDGIQEGREVFSNTIKYIKMTMASNFGNFYAVAIATLLIDYLPMLPIQILLVNLLSDFPLIAIATDSVDANEIKKPESYNLKDFALIATVLGIVSSLFDFIFFGVFSRISPEVLHTNWFIGSILTELALLYSLRTRLPFYKAKRPPSVIIILTVFAAAAALIIPYTGLGQNIFHFTPPTLTHLGICFAIIITYFISTESVKLLYYRVFPDTSSK